MNEAFSFGVVGVFPLAAAPTATAATATVTLSEHKFNFDGEAKQASSLDLGKKKLVSRESKRREQFKTILLPNNQVRKLQAQRAEQRKSMLVSKRTGKKTSSGSTATTAGASGAIAGKQAENKWCEDYLAGSIEIANGIHKQARQYFDRTDAKVQHEFLSHVWRKLQTVVTALRKEQQQEPKKVANKITSSTVWQFMGGALELIVDKWLAKSSDTVIVLMQGPYEAANLIHDLWILLSSNIASGGEQNVKPILKDEGYLKFQTEIMLMTQAFLQKEEGHSSVPLLAKRWAVHVPALLQIVSSTNDPANPMVLIGFQLLRTWLEALPGIIISLPATLDNDNEEAFQEFEILHHITIPHWMRIIKHVLVYLGHLVTARFGPPVVAKSAASAASAAPLQQKTDAKKPRDVRLFWDPDTRPLPRTNKDADHYVEALLDALLGCLIRLCSTQNQQLYAELLKSSDLLPSIVALCQYESILVQEAATSLLLIFCKDDGSYTKAFFQRIADPLGQHVRDFYLSWHYDLNFHTQTLERADHLDKWQLVRRNIASLLFNWFVVQPSVIVHFVAMLPSWHTIVRETRRCETQMEVLRILKVATEEMPAFAKTAFTDSLLLATVQSALLNPHHASLTLEALEYFNNYFQFWKSQGETKYDQMLKVVLNYGVLYHAITNIVDMPQLPLDVENLAEALVAELDDASEREEEGRLC